MYWATGEFVTIKRFLAVPGPYRCVIDGEEYGLVLTYIIESTEYVKDQERVMDTIGANGYTVPDNNLAGVEKFDAWHVDDPDNRVTLTVTPSQATAYATITRFHGEGSILCMGLSLDATYQGQG